MSRCGTILDYRIFTSYQNESNMISQSDEKFQLNLRTGFSFSSIVIISIFFSLIMTNLEAFQILFKIVVLKSSDEKIVKSIDAKAELHRALLLNNLYIPMEDIYTKSDLALTETRIISNCSIKGELYFWLPIPVVVPIIGKKIIERCISI